MLDHPDIEVRTGVDAGEVLKFTEDGIYFDGKKFEGNVIYTGALDELFALLLWKTAISFTPL